MQENLDNKIINNTNYTIRQLSSIVESILFSCANEVSIKQIMLILEIDSDCMLNIINYLKNKYQDDDSGIELIILDDKIKLVSKVDNHRFIYPFVDDDIKPKLTNSLLETLSIIAYNPRITRPQTEMIRGVNVDASFQKLLEYNLITQSGKSDLPGKPMTYITTPKFLELFGISSLDELPELPKYEVLTNTDANIRD